MEPEPTSRYTVLGKLMPHVDIIREEAHEMTAELLLSSSGGTTAMTVNDTVAAHGFLRRLPFSGVWSPCAGELYCTAPRLVYDPSELGLGCACGDVTLSRGWLAVHLEDVRSGEEMVIGRVEDVTALGPRPFVLAERSKE